MNNILQGIVNATGGKVEEHHRSGANEQWTVSFALVTEALAFQDACLLCSQVLYVSDVSLNAERRACLTFVQARKS